MPEASDSNQSFALQLIYPEQTGMFARIAQTIGQHGGDLGRIDMLGPAPRLTTRGISIRVRDERHLAQIVEAVRTLDKVKVIDVSKPALPGAASLKNASGKSAGIIGRTLRRRGLKRAPRRFAVPHRSPAKSR